MGNKSKSIQEFIMPFQNTFREFSASICGLVFHLSDLETSSHEDIVPVPLKNVDIESHIINFVAEINVTQSYVNVETNPIEAIYMFPIEEAAAVISFEAEIEDRLITIHVEEKEEVRNVYRDAMKEKKTAVLLEEMHPDIFEIKLGQLRPNTAAKIKITYVSELPVEDGKVKLTIPNTIAPRYIPPNDLSEAAAKLASIPYASNTSAPLSVNFSGVSPCKIRSIKSSSHDFKITTSESPDDNGKYAYNGELSSTSTQMDRDIVLYFDAYDKEERNKPIAFIDQFDCKNNKGTIAMVSLVPNFKFDEQLSELIFLVDISGYMSRIRIEQAVKALDLFLHSLPEDCYFNIWSLGSKYSALFPDGSKRYCDQSLNEAWFHVKSMKANYGRTELFKPLQQIIMNPCREKKYLKQIFIITDREASNTSSIISLVKKNKDISRVFTLGIGHSVSRYLVKGVARAGGGTAVFAQPNEDLRVKVMEQLKNALQPAFSNVHIHWNEKMKTQPVERILEETYLIELVKSRLKRSEDTDRKSSYNLEGQVPTLISPIFDGTRFLAYQIYEQGSSIPKTITLNADSPNGPMRLEININESNILHKTGFVLKLAARKKIQELEEYLSDFYGYYRERDLKKEVREAIVRLGIEYNLASQFTSFVGVDQLKEDGKKQIPLLTRMIKSKRFNPTLSRSYESSSESCSDESDCESAYDEKEYYYLPPPPQTPNKSISDDSSAPPPPASRYLTAPLTRFPIYTSQDRITSLIHFQKSNGIFELSSDDWEGSVFHKYAGKYFEVTANCPEGIPIASWLTALAISILKMKMNKKRTLWELVAQKSMKSLKRNHGDEHQMLIVKAEEFIEHH